MTGRRRPDGFNPLAANSPHQRDKLLVTMEPGHPFFLPTFTATDGAQARASPNRQNPGGNEACRSRAEAAADLSAGEQFQDVAVGVRKVDSASTPPIVDLHILAGPG